MAKSSSSAVPGDVEWLPGLGGSRVLRIHPPSPEPPALILRTAGGAEVRVEARPGPATEYDIPSELDWSTAWLQWPDGTRATVPAPHGAHAQVIELRSRRDRALVAEALAVVSLFVSDVLWAVLGVAHVAQPMSAGKVGAARCFVEKPQGLEAEDLRAAAVQRRHGERLARVALLGQRCGDQALHDRLRALQTHRERRHALAEDEQQTSADAVDGLTEDGLTAGA